MLPARLSASVFRLRDMMFEARFVDVIHATPVAQGTNRHYCGQIAPQIVVGSPEFSISLLYSGPAERQKSPMSPSSPDRLRDLKRLTRRKKVDSEYVTMWASEITGVPEQFGTFLWGLGHDAKGEEPNLDLFLLQLRERDRGPGVGSTWHSGMMGNPKGGPGGKRGQERSSLCSYQPPAAWPSGLLLEGVKFFYELQY